MANAFVFVSNEVGGSLYFPRSAETFTQSVQVAGWAVVSPGLHGVDLAVVDADATPRGDQA